MKIDSLNSVEITPPKNRISPVRPLRDSETHWLGKVPSNWPQKRLKFAIQLVNDKVEAAGSELPYVGMENIQSATGRLMAGLPEDSADGLSNSFRPDDVLFGKLRPYLAKVLHANANGLCSSELLVMRPRDVLPRFLLYYCLSPEFIRVVDSSTYGSKMPRASWQFIGNLPVLVPPLDEQRAIAAFLDHETAKIDELIAKNTALREALFEKRQSLVTHVVCRGLRSERPGKSALEFPESWKVGKLRWYCASIRDGTHNPPPRASGPFRLLSVRNLVGGQFVLLSDDRTMDEDAFNELQRSYTVKKGDVVLAIVGATTGKSAVVDEIENVTVQRSLAILRPRAVLNCYFLNYWIQSRPLQSQIGETANKYAAQPGIYLNDVAELPLPVPPISEQRSVVSFLDSKCAEFQKLTRRIDDGIGKLNEYRAGLISAAVTGRIDPRNYRPEAPCP